MIALRRIAGSGTAARIVRGGAWGVLGTGLGRVFNLVAMIFVARLLGREDFGALGLLQTTLAVLGVVAGTSLGLTGVRFVAEHRVSAPARAGRFIGLIWSVSILTTAAVAIGVAVFAGPLSQRLLNGPDFRAAMMAGGLVVAMTVFRTVQDAIFSGFEHFREGALLRLLEGVALLAAVPVLAATLGVTGAVLGMAAAAMVALVVGFWLQRAVQRHAGVPTDLRGCWAEWRVLGRFSGPTLLSSLLTLPGLWIGLFWLSRSGGLSELGLYNAAYQWYGPMTFVPMVLCNVSMPMLVQRWAAGDRHGYRRLYLGVTASGFALALVPALLAAALSPWIMHIYGTDFVAGWPVLALLMAAAPFQIVGNVALTAMQSMGNAWHNFASNLFWLIAFLLASATLVPPYGAGGLAAAMAVSFAAAAAQRTATVLFVTSKGSAQ